MFKREWKVYVEDILESIDLVEKYTEDMEYEQFVSDRKTIDAVVRNFEIIGEASKYIRDDVKSRYPDVDWRAIVGLRNRIAHEYFGVSLEIVWDIIEHEIPKLKGQMEQILKALK